MSASVLPPINELRNKSQSEQIEALDALFEPSPAIHSTLLPVVDAKEYSSWPELIDICHKRFLELATASSNSSTDPVLLSILGSHPRLGEKKITSAHSAAEQANIQKTTDDGQAEELARLNREYEEAFPGLRYVIFVNGRGRPEIMKNMRARISKGDYAQEVETALQAMCDIAKDRASKLH